jgi:hypothetical protein
LERVNPENYTPLDVSVGLLTQAYSAGTTLENMAKESVNIVGETAGGMIRTAAKGVVFAMVGTTTLVVTIVGGFYVLGKYVQGTEATIFREGEIFKALLSYAKANSQMLELLQKGVKAGTGIVPPSVVGTLVLKKNVFRYRKLF